MPGLKRLFEFYLNSSIHVALAVCSLAWITIISFDLQMDRDLLFFIFFSTISSYNFVKYFGLAKFHHRSLSPWLKEIQIFSFLCFIPLTYFTFQLSYETLLYLGLVGIVTFFYAMPFLPKSIFIEGGKNLRAISGLKVYVIAFVWAMTTVIIPIKNGGHDLSTDVIITAIQRFLYVLIAMLPFEIRDMRYDSLKLSTIPQRIGIKQTKLIGVLLIMMFFFLEYFKDELDVKHLVVRLLVAVLLLAAVLFSKVKQSKYFSSFGVEAIPIIWLGLLLI